MAQQTNNGERTALSGITNAFKTPTSLSFPDKNWPDLVQTATRGRNTTQRRTTKPAKPPTTATHRAGSPRPQRKKSTPHDDDAPPLVSSTPRHRVHFASTMAHNEDNGATGQGHASSVDSTSGSSKMTADGLDTTAKLMDFESTDGDAGRKMAKLATRQVSKAAHDNAIHTLRQAWDDQQSHLGVRGPMQTPQRPINVYKDKDTSTRPSLKGGVRRTIDRLSHGSDDMDGDENAGSENASSSHSSHQGHRRRHSAEAALPTPTTSTRVFTSTTTPADPWVGAHCAHTHTNAPSSSSLASSLSSSAPKAYATVASKTVVPSAGSGGRALPVPRRTRASVSPHDRATSAPPSFVSTWLGDARKLGRDGGGGGFDDHYNGRSPLRAETAPAFIAAALGGGSGARSPHHHGTKGTGGGSGSGSGYTTPPLSCASDDPTTLPALAETKRTSPTRKPHHPALSSSPRITTPSLTSPVVTWKATPPAPPTAHHRLPPPRTSTSPSTSSSDAPPLPSAPSLAATSSTAAAVAVAAEAAAAALARRAARTSQGPATPDHTPATTSTSSTSTSSSSSAKGAASGLSSMGMMHPTKTRPAPKAPAGRRVSTAGMPRPTSPLKNQVVTARTPATSALATTTASSLLSAPASTISPLCKGVSASDGGSAGATAMATVAAASMHTPPTSPETPESSALDAVSGTAAHSKPVLTASTATVTASRPTLIGRLMRTVLLIAWLVMLWPLVLCVRLGVLPSFGLFADEPESDTDKKDGMDTAFPRVLKASLKPSSQTKKQVSTAVAAARPATRRVSFALK
eukprot:m.16266 g.16266  ORF g.16266 m.16266 type:complete len:802 (-) comp3370_c0_seq1:149-2554(-)